MIVLRGIMQLLRSATPRAMLTLLVALSIAMNAGSGAFAGVLHAHDHEHGHHHYTHDLDDDHKHLDHEDTVPAPADGNAPSSYHEMLHEHGSNVVLALVHVDTLPLIGIEPPPTAGPPRGALSDLKHHLERPPRLA